jgi:hypothetical protein
MKRINKNMKNILILTLLLASPALAQHTFDLKNASKFFDVKINVEKCEDDSCTGKASFSFFKKGGAKAYQVITLPDTYIDTSEGGVPAVNETMLYDKQSVIVVDDFNFDGMEDVAICDGPNGGYGMPSYRIYLSSRAAGKFVHSPAFSDLGSHLGMFEVDKEDKTLQIMDKSGCCWHESTRYKVIGGRPVKVWVLTEDAQKFDEKANKRIVVTTEKTLVKGRWKTHVTTERVKDDN